MNPLLAGLGRAAVGTAKAAGRGVKKVGRGIKKSGKFTLRNMAGAARMAGADNIPIFDKALTKMESMGKKSKKTKSVDSGAEDVVKENPGNPSSIDPGSQEILKQNEQHHSETQSEDMKTRMEQRANEAAQHLEANKNNQIQEEILHQLEGVNDRLDDLNENGGINGKDNKGSEGSGILGSLASMAGMAMGGAALGKVFGKGKGLIKALNPMTWFKSSKSISAKNFSNFSTVSNATKMHNAPFKNIANTSSSIVNSVGKTTKNSSVIAKAATGTGIAAAAGTAAKVSKTAGKGLLKSAVKKIPVLGALAGVGFGIQRLLKGDFVGAGMEVASGAASLLPGAGTAASIGIDSALIARDHINGKEEEIDNQLAEAQYDIQNPTKTNSFSRYFEDKYGDTVDNTKTSNSSTSNLTQLEQDRQSLYQSHSNFMNKNSEVDNGDMYKTSNDYGVLSKSAYNTNTMDMSREIPNEYLTASAAIKEYHTEIKEMNKQSKEPIIIQTPPTPVISKEIKTGGGSGGAMAPLMTATLDSTIKAIHLRNMMRGTA